MPGSSVCAPPSRYSAATVYELAERGSRGEWVPQLIGPGDLPLSARSVRDSLLDSGLVTDHRTGASLREIATAEIADPDHPETGRRPPPRPATGTGRLEPEQPQSCGAHRYCPVRLLDLPTSGGPPRRHAF